MGLHVLITGASGYSGAAICMSLLAKGYRVTAVKGANNSRLPLSTQSDSNLKIVSADLSQDFQMPDAVNAVIHTAARSAWPGVSTEDMVRDNVIATQNLINSSLKCGVSRFIHFSSLSVHGKIEADVVDQRTPVLNPDAYGVTKRLCEQMLESAAGPSMACLAIRLPGIIGPGSIRNWLSTTLAKSKRGEDISVFDTEAKFNNAVHVADLATFIEKLLTHKWNGYDAGPLGAGGLTSAGEVAQMLAQAGGGKSAISKDKSPRKSYTISSDWAIQRYGYCPMNITEMIQQFISENQNQH